MKKILFITDHKWRDLPGNVYLKHLLESNGNCKVKLIRLNEERLIAPSYKPDLVIYNNLYNKSCRDYARYLASKNVKIVILPTEGITFSKDQLDLFSHKNLDIEFVDLYLSWNRSLKNNLLLHKKLSPKKVIVTGSLRFDFYQKKFEKFLSNKKQLCIKYDLNEKLPIILLTTNFANAEFYKNNLYLKNEIKMQGASNLKSFKHTDSLSEYEYFSRIQCLEWVEKLLESNVKLNLLIKPHPSERLDLYEKFALKYNKSKCNVKIIKNEYIWNVLKHTDILLQRCSTVAIEAWLLKTVTVEMKFLDPKDHFLQPIFESGSFSYDNKNDFIEGVANILENLDSVSQPCLSENRKALLENIVENVDECCGDKIKTALYRLLETTKPIDNISYQNTVFFMKSLLYRCLPAKTYVLLTNLYKGKYTDYLGRHDKNFYENDRIYWEKQLKPILYSE